MVWKYWRLLFRRSNVEENYHEPFKERSIWNNLWDCHKIFWKRFLNVLMKCFIFYISCWIVVYKSLQMNQTAPKGRLVGISCSWTYKNVLNQTIKRYRVFDMFRVISEKIAFEISIFYNGCFKVCSTSDRDRDISPEINT